MGQKVRPTGFRTGIMIDWQSQWYASKQDFAELLVEDQKIRNYIKRRYGRSGISRIRIERTREKVVVYIYSARVGMIIGKKGQEVEKLTQELESLAHRHVEVKTMEINRPEVDPQLVAEDIAEQLEKRASFRRTMKACSFPAVWAARKWPDKKPTWRVACRFPPCGPRSNLDLRRLTPPRGI